MATTEFGVNHPLAVKVWSKKLYAEAYRETFFGRFIGTGKNALISEKTELKKSAGDKITCGLRPQLSGDGIEGDNTLEGNEEALRFFDDSVTINQLRHATRSKGKMSEQRVPYNIRQEGLDGLSDWFARRMDTVMFNHLCHNVAETRSIYTGFNAITEATANRIVRAGGKANDESLASGDVFDLDIIIGAREKALNASTMDDTGPIMRPVRHQGEDMFVMFLHDYQERSLRAQNSQWEQIQKQALAGGDVAGNPIFTNALGVFNNVILHRASRVTNGVSSVDDSAVANTKRAVLCGAQALTVAFGGDGGASRYTWKEDMFDYENQLGISAGTIWGCKATKFIPADDSATNAEDFGTVVVPTYATPYS